MNKAARTALLFAGDVLMLVTAFFLMLAVSFPSALTPEIANSHIAPFAFTGLVWIVVFFIFSLYEVEFIKPTIPNLKRIGLASIVAVTTSALFFYIIPQFGITPKTNLVIFGMIFALLFMSWRRLLHLIFAAYFRRNVALITNAGETKSSTQELINYINTYPQSDLYLVETYHSVSEFIEKSPKNINMIIVSRESLQSEEDLKILYDRKIRILDIARAYEDMLGKIPVSEINQDWIIQNIQSKNTSLYEVSSRLLGIITSILLLVLTSPFLFIAALAVKIYDRGPIFFIQKRVGKNGREFKFYKFRTMIVDADKNGAMWTEKNDGRITPVGKILRRLHIDEVPQLWNILKGDIALVGPRPEITGFAKELEHKIPYYGMRHVIPPGFTGWAQIKFQQAKGVEETKEKFEYDLYYIKNRNIFMDMGILLRTAMIIFTHK